MNALWIRIPNCFKQDVGNPGLGPKDVKLSVECNKAEVGLLPTEKIKNKRHFSITFLIFLIHVVGISV